MDLKMHVYSVPLRSPASLRILRWGNASDQKSEVGELCSPTSYYTLTTDVDFIICCEVVVCGVSCDSFIYLIFSSSNVYFRHEKFSFRMAHTKGKTGAENWRRKK